MTENVQESSHAYEGVSFATIAQREGTPLYVYSAGQIRERYTELDRAFGDYPHHIHYALKANSTLGLARVIRSLGGELTPTQVERSRLRGAPASAQPTLCLRVSGNRVVSSSLRLDSACKRSTQNRVESSSD